MGRPHWNGSQAYSDSKLFDVVLAFAVARRWPDVLSNALEPGWVATRMGGPGAPDDMSQAAVTQAWLAVSDDPAATVTGEYFYHQRPRPFHPAAASQAVQDRLLAVCAELTGIELPRRRPDHEGCGFRRPPHRRGSTRGRRRGPGGTRRRRAPGDVQRYLRTA